MTRAPFSLLVAAWLIAPLWAQVPTSPGPQANEPWVQEPQQTRGIQPWGGLGIWGRRDPNQGNDGFTPTWMSPTPPGFKGFPVFPSRLRGYGNYPLPTDPGALPSGGLGGLPIPMMLPPADPEPPGWPAWLRAQAKAPLPYSPELALLARSADRVWFREAAVDPFVPLYFHDKLRTLTVEGEVEVRGRGEFQLLLHDSSRFAANGASRVRLDALDEANVKLTVERFTWCSLQATRRAHRIALPDGSELVVDPASATAPTTTAAVPLPFAMLLGLGVSDLETTPVVHLTLQRADEPAWFGGRATMTNLGNVAVVWRHALGETKLPPQSRLTFFLAPPTVAAPHDLEAGAARVEQRGGDVTLRTREATDVSWCGARVSLPAGGQVTFESLQGDAFAPAPRPRASSVGAGG